LQNDLRIENADDKEIKFQASLSEPLMKDKGELKTNNLVSSKENTKEVGYWRFTIVWILIANWI